MGKSVHPDVLDGALGVIRNNATQMVVLGAAPASYAAASGGALASVTVASGDFTLGAGQTSGRKASIAAKSNVPVTASGTGNHIALLDPANSRLLYVTTCTAQALTSGGTVNVSGWSIEIADPA